MMNIFSPSSPAAAALDQIFNVDSMPSILTEQIDIIDENPAQEEEVLKTDSANKTPGGLNFFTRVSSAVADDSGSPCKTTAPDTRDDDEADDVAAPASSERANAAALEGREGVELASLSPGSIDGALQDLGASVKNGASVPLETNSMAANNELTDPGEAKTAAFEEPLSKEEAQELKRPHSEEGAAEKTEEAATEITKPIFESNLSNGNAEQEKKSGMKKSAAVAQQPQARQEKKKASASPKGLSLKTRSQRQKSACNQKSKKNKKSLSKMLRRFSSAKKFASNKSPSKNVSDVAAAPATEKPVVKDNAPNLTTKKTPPAEVVVAATLPKLESKASKPAVTSKVTLEMVVTKDSVAKEEKTPPEAVPVAATPSKLEAKATNEAVTSKVTLEMVVTKDSVQKDDLGDIDENPAEEEEVLKTETADKTPGGLDSFSRVSSAVTECGGSLYKTTAPDTSGDAEAADVVAGCTSPERANTAALKGRDCVEFANLTWGSIEEALQEFGNTVKIGASVLLETIPNANRNESTEPREVKAAVFEEPHPLEETQDARLALKDSVAKEEQDNAAIESPESIESDRFGPSLSMVSASKLPGKETQPLGGPKYYILTNNKTGQAKIYHEAMPSQGASGAIADERGYEVVEYALINTGEEVAEQNEAKQGQGMMESLMSYYTSAFQSPEVSPDELPFNLSLVSTSELPGKETQPLGGPKYYIATNNQTGQAKIYHEAMPTDGDGSVSIPEESGYEVVEYALVKKEKDVAEEGCGMMESLMDLYNSAIESSKAAHDLHSI